MYLIDHTFKSQYPLRREKFSLAKKLICMVFAPYLGQYLTNPKSECTMPYYMLNSLIKLYKSF